MNKTEFTLDYYNQQAEKFVQSTVDVEFSHLQNLFIEMLPAGGTILDLGCGSGRDSKAYKKAGFNVIAVDGSEALCKIAEEYIGQQVICRKFQDLDISETLDGIWACASLLHLEMDDIVETMKKLTNRLCSGGIFYVSFKYGNFSGKRNGRYFTDMTEDSFAEIKKQISGLRIVRQMITNDARPDRDEKWLNVFLKKE
ncbi:MAG: class I SAM-dependent methyltransferase [Clostridium sp.]